MECFHVFGIPETWKFRWDPTTKNLANPARSSASSENESQTITQMRKPAKGIARPGRIIAVVSPFFDESLASDS